MRSYFLGALAIAGAFAAVPALAQQNEQFIPSLVYRTGPFGPSGTDFADGFADYLNLLNLRDGGINGVKITFEECETAYNNDRGVECYERLKNKGPTGAAAISPLSTGITYALVDRAAQDKIPLLTMGYGRADASDGRVFPWVFTLPTTYWDGASVLVQYMGKQEGGTDKLKGKKVAHVFLDSAYGKEPIETFKLYAEKYGFDLSLFPVPSPGLEQKSTWLQIRQLRPDYVTLWGWGVMNPTSLKEAAAIGYPREKILGVWYSGQDDAVIPAGDAAKGYKALNFHGAGKTDPVHKDLMKFVRDAGKGSGDGKNFASISYNRGVVNAVLVTESIRKAQEKFGKKPLTGEQVRWGIENLDLDVARLKALGADNLIQPVKMSCADHQGGGSAKLQQWDGKEWKILTDWMQGERDVIRPLYEKSAAQYAKEKNITPRDCSKES